MVIVCPACPARAETDLSTMPHDGRANCIAMETILSVEMKQRCTDSPFCADNEFSHGGML